MFYNKIISYWIYEVKFVLWSFAPLRKWGQATKTIWVVRLVSDS